MDEIDTKIIALLRQDCRMSVANLALRLGLARATVTNRIRRLEESQVIVGYSVQLKPETAPAQMKAWMAIQVEGNRSAEVVASLLGDPNTIGLHDTNGTWDLLAELRADSLSDLSRVLERMRLIKGIRHTETNIHLRSYKDWMSN